MTLDNIRRNATIALTSCGCAARGTGSVATTPPPSREASESIAVSAAPGSTQLTRIPRSPPRSWAAARLTPRSANFEAP
ncbi:hypothetical protein FQZ97_1121250 [compost metagenome]